MLLDTIVTLPQRLGEASLQPPPRDGMRRAAVAVVLHGYDLLLMKRAERATDPWSGHVSLPGGRVEPEDPHLLATAIREAREELDIELSSERSGARLLGSLPTIHPLMTGPRGIEVTPFVFAITERPELRISAEAQSLFWLPLVEVATGSLDTLYAHESGRSFPAWLYQGYTIWGMTMRVISELLEHLRAPSHAHAAQPAP